MRKVPVLALFLVFSVSTAFLPADQRKENIDIIVAVDKSLSMVGEIEAVKEYFNSYIVDQVAIAGDFLVVVAFYGKPEILFAGEIQGNPDRAAVREKIREIRANGRYTDIGSALDAIKEQFDARAGDGRKKFVLLITDGIQEAPPESRYYSKDGKFNHAFLENAKTIQKEGWKIQVLGIGTVTAGEDLSKELSATFQEIPQGATLEALKENTTGLFGTIEAVGGVRITAPDARGDGAVSLELKSRGFPAAVKVQVSAVRVEDPSRPVGDVLPSAWTVELPGEGSTAVRIPVVFPKDLPSGTGPVRVFFSFAPGERFTPIEFESVLSVPAWLQLHLLPVAAGGAAALLLAAAAVLLLFRRAANRSVDFTVFRDGKQILGCPVYLRPRQAVYLQEAKGDLLLSPKRTPEALAAFSAQSGKLSMKPIRSDRFAKLGEVPPDVLGWSFVLQSPSGKTVKVEIKRVERA